MLTPYSLLHFFQFNFGTSVFRNFGSDFNQLVDLMLPFAQLERIINLADRGACFKSQLVAIDVNDLVKLCIFGHAFHERLAGHVVHLRPANGDDIDGSRNRIFGLQACGHIG